MPSLLSILTMFLPYWTSIKDNAPFKGASSNHALWAWLVIFPMGLDRTGQMGIGGQARMLSVPSGELVVGHPIPKLQPMLLLNSWFPPSAGDIRPFRWTPAASPSSLFWKFLVGDHALAILFSGVFSLWKKHRTVLSLLSAHVEIIFSLFFALSKMMKMRILSNP